MTKIDGRGKAPKAGKGAGRKPLAPELKKEETKTVSIRLPVSSIKFHGIDGAWLFDAAMQKISATTICSPTIQNISQRQTHMLI